MKRRVLVAVVALAAVLAGACEPASVQENDAIRSDADDAEGAVREATSAQSLVDNGLGALGTAAPDPTATLPYLPVGCAKVTRDGATFTFAYDGCRVRGRALSGGFVATVSGTRLDRDASISNIDLRWADATVKGSAELAFRAEDTQTRKHATTATLEGTRAGGRAFSLHANLERTLELDTRCIRLAGDFEGTLDGASVTMALEGFRACAGGCPDPGAKLTVHRKNGSTLVLAWDGSPRITVTVDGQPRASIPAQCAAE